MYLICSKTPDTLELTNDTVKDLLYAPYSRNWDKMMAERHKNHKVYKTGLTAYRITPTLIAKYFSRSEAANMEYVRKQTKIPVPQPRYPHLKEYMVMDFVEGRTLLECWEDLSVTFLGPWMGGLLVECFSRMSLTVHSIPPIDSEHGAR